MSDETKYSGSFKRKSPFDLKVHGVEARPDRDYRWVREDRVQERQNSDGYVKSSRKKDDLNKEPINVKGMILMDRPKEMAEESRKYKEAETRARSQAVRHNLDEEVEKMSSKHGVNLHKYFYDDGSN